MIPNLLWKTEVPKKIPTNLQKVVNKLKNSKGKENCLKDAYKIITKKYWGCQTFKNFLDLFVMNIKKLWKKKSPLHCTNLNYLLRFLLVKSELFKENEIEQKLTFVGYIWPHQYLRVKINNKKYINVDPWGKAHGIIFGNYAKGFNFKSEAKH
jgi:hypothetical protein